MRGISYLMVDLDVFELAKTLGGLLREDRRMSSGRMLDLWRWGVANTPNHVPITGIFEDQDPVELLEAGLEWTGDPGKLFAAYTRTGLVRLLDPNPETGLQRFEIRGLPRYEDFRKRRAKDAERKRLERNPKPPDGHPPDVQRTSNGHPGVENRREYKRRLKPPYPPPTSNLRVVPEPTAEALGGGEKEKLQPEATEAAATTDALVEVHAEAVAATERAHAALQAALEEAKRLAATAAEWGAANAVFAASIPTRETGGVDPVEHPLLHSEPVKTNAPSHRGRGAGEAPPVEHPDLAPEEPPATAEQVRALWPVVRARFGYVPELKPTWTNLPEFLAFAWTLGMWEWYFAKCLQEPLGSARFASGNRPVGPLLMLGVLSSRVPLRPARWHSCARCREPATLDGPSGSGRKLCYPCRSGWESTFETDNPLPESERPWRIFTHPHVPEAERDAHNTALAAERSKAEAEHYEKQLPHFVAWLERETRDVLSRNVTPDTVPKPGRSAGGGGR